MQKPKNNTLKIVIIAAIAVLVLMCVCACIVLAIAQTGSRQAESPQATPAKSTELSPTKPQQPESKPTTEKPTPTDSPTQAPQFGISRDNPYPLGSSVDIGGDVYMTVTAITRAMDSMVEKGNMFNQKPESGQEYIKIDLEFTCKKDTSDKCLISPYGIKTVGGDGNIWEPQSFLAGVSGMLEQSEIFGGATKKGSLFFIVTKDDLPVILFTDTLFGGQTYFATE